MIKSTHIADVEEAEHGMYKDVPSRHTTHDPSYTKGVKKFTVLELHVPLVDKKKQRSKTTRVSEVLNFLLCLAKLHFTL